MSLRPDDLVLVCVKAPTGNHKIADQWEVTPHHVLSQVANQPVSTLVQDCGMHCPTTLKPLPH